VVLKYEEPSLTNQKTKLLDILDAAAKFYRNNLLDMAEAAPAREYLFQKRALKEEIAEEFCLGFAPDSWDALIKFLCGKGFAENDIFLAGLSVKKERGSGFYDRFRARIMFPIRDVHGHVVGFTGRLMPEAERREGAGGKYVNTPQTMVYNKSYVIYGLDLAKQTIKKENLAIMVEGNMDVIASHQAGVKNVVASSGTAMTIEQVKLLKRYSSNLAISFDADLAGSVASSRGIDVALREGMNIKVIALSPDIGKDPDDYIKKDPGLWQEAISNSLPFMDYYIKKTLSSLDLRKIEDKKGAARALLAEVVKIPDKVEQTYYLEKLANVLGVPEQILRESMPREKDLNKSEIFGAKNRAETVDKAFLLPAKNRSSLLAESFLSLILKYPRNLKYAIDYLEPFMLPAGLSREIYKSLILYYNKDVDKKDGTAIFNEIVKNPEDKNYINGLLLFAEKDFAEFDEDKIKTEILKSAKALRENYILEERKRLEGEMRRAEERGDLLKIKELSEEFNKFISI